MAARQRKVLIAKIAAAAGVCALICLLAYWAEGPASSDAPSPRWYSIVPPLLAVTLALVTGRLRLCLLAAIVAGGLLSIYNKPFQGISTVWQGLGGDFLWEAVVDVDLPQYQLTVNQQILLFVVLVMATISVMLVGGGLQGVANWLARFARSARGTRLATLAMGLVIFIDDYANTMIVGSTMRPMTDRWRISREKLAFLVDATAAPVAGVAFISTWIGYEVGLLTVQAEGLGIERSGYALFFDAMWFRFYCLGMLIFVFLNAISGIDFGPMARAERRARDEGKVLGDDATPMTSRDMSASRPHPQARVHMMVAVGPMLALFGVFLAGLWYDGGGMDLMRDDATAPLQFSAWRAVLESANNILLLAVASGVGLVVAMGLAIAVARVPWTAVAWAVLVGVRSSLMPLSVLILAWALGGACGELRTGDFLAGLLQDTVPAALFPAMVFIVAGLAAFSTGTSWGTMAILIPIAVPVAHAMDGDACGLITVISIAAVLDGAIFGDHCSPISDTTIMSSTASSCDHLAHVRTQIPYSLTVAGIVLCAGYVPAAMGAPKWIGMVGATAVMGLLITVLAIRRRG